MTMRKGPPKRGDDLYDMPRAPGIPPRWIAVAYYKIDGEIVDVQHDIEELDMLHDMIERGHDWNTLDRIEIRLAMVNEPA